MKDFVFVSGNLHKVKWLGKFLSVEVEHQKLDLDELQSPDPLVVIEDKVKKAHQIIKRPVLVDDVSLKFTAWGDMPGTFVKFFVEGPGLEKMCRMLDGFIDRSASMVVSYGYYDGHELKIFQGITKGQIAEHKGSDNIGHGFDPIFIPSGQSLPHSDLTEQAYMKNHPRGKAVTKLKLYLDQGNKVA